MKKTAFLFCLLIFYFLHYHSQTTTSFSAYDIYFRLNKLKKKPSVLYIAAHPDDENTRLIAFLTNKLHFRTAYLSLTKGSGGQNLIGNEKSVDLGLLRSQELLSARKKDGGKQFFTRAYDFGYSKSVEETLKTWGEDNILQDVVFIIRYFKPDVIITRFSADSKRGHGHHTASAVLAAKAFSLSNSKDAFPEQLKHVSLWQAKRLLHNSTIHYWNPDADVSHLLPLNVGEYIPEIGLNTGEISSTSRSMHKSQGFGVRASMGKQMEYFEALNGDNIKHIKSPFEQLELTQNDDKEKEVNAILQTIKKSFDPSKPYTIFKPLTSLREIFIKKNDVYRKKITEHLMLAVNGIRIQWSSNDEYCITNTKNDFTFHIIKNSPNKVTLHQLNYQGKSNTTTYDTTLNINLVNNQRYSFQHNIFLSSQDISQPYWLEKEHSNIYSISNIEYLKIPKEFRHNSGNIELSIQGYRFHTTIEINHLKLIANKGEITQPLHIIPPISISFNKKVHTSFDDEDKQIHLTIRSNKKENISANVVLTLPDEWSIKQQSFQNPIILYKGETKDLSFTLSSTSMKKNTYILSATAEVKKIKYNQSLSEIDYEHIQKQVWFPKAKTKLLYFKKKPNTTKRIAYVMGSGDEIANSLQEIGYPLDMLNSDNIQSQNLTQYSCIILGIRAFNIHKKLLHAKRKLWQYAANGGTLLIQYNTNNWIGKLEDTLTPSYFHISRNRVTDEHSAVKFLIPKHKIFNTPYNISQQSFKDWIQERGIYFSDKADKNWQKPLALKDFNSDWDDGSLIIHNYGKGAIIYTGLSFFREIPAGIIGATKLFINLIEYKP